jgi:hypothetical protein
MHSRWIQRADNPENIQTYIAINNESHAKVLEDYKKSNYLMIVKTSKIGVCYPSYQLSSNLGIMMGSCENGDIIIFASDDFLAPPRWDTYLRHKLEGKGDIGLHVRDGYQNPDSSNMIAPAITIPIMTYGCLLKLNRIIYNPAYTHMYSDCELYINLKDLGLLYDDRIHDETTFEHLHHAAGKRDRDKNDMAYARAWGGDELTWNTRKKMAVNDRLTIDSKTY